jgi:hypothetical protein
VKIHSAFLNGTTKICGFISDKADFEVLPGANIVVEGTNLAATTNQMGYYEIDNVPLTKFYLTVTRIPYHSVSHYELLVKPNQLVRLDFELEQVPVVISVQQGRQ